MTAGHRPAGRPPRRGAVWGAGGLLRVPGVHGAPLLSLGRRRRGAVWGACGLLRVPDVHGALLLSLGRRAGALFGVPVGFCVCLACTALGTALCYLVYNTFGGPLVRRLFVEQARRICII